MARPPTDRSKRRSADWATGHNIFAIPLAAGILYNVGVAPTPAMGTVLMSLSTIIVAINAQLLKRARLGG